MAQEFKLKGLTSLDLKNGDKVEYEVEGIEGGKVLLVKIKDQVHGLNTNCTHFGAPLKNGVLTSDGRITCPWHGACFSVSTGDVEDAPAPDSLHHFDVVEKDGAVYVKGQQDHIKTNRRYPDVKVQSAEPERVVIVGGGSGTFGAVQKLREHKFKGHITIIGDEGYLPIDRTKLSKALIPDPSKIELRSKDWYNTASVDLVSDTVTSVDFEGRTVTTKSGKSHPYNRLILASGGIPRTLPLPGFKDNELSNIFVLRTATDVQGITSALGNKNKNVVVVGSSFIGMEVGNALAKENNVSIIGMESEPLERVMGTEVGAIFRKTLEKNGAKFHMNASVDSAVPSSSITAAVGLASVGAVKLKDGTSLPADLVILGIGVRPSTDYLKENPAVKLEKDGSIAVDKNFAITGVKDAYAIGDIATYPYHGPGGNGTPIRVEHWNHAQNGGKHVADIIAKSKPLKDFQLPIFWSALGGQLRYAGNTQAGGFDEVIVKGSKDEGKWIAYYTKGEEVVAVAGMGMDPAPMKTAELLRVGKMLSVEEVRKGETGKEVLDVEI